MNVTCIGLFAALGFSEIAIGSVVQCPCAALRPELLGSHRRMAQISMRAQYWSCCHDFSAKYFFRAGSCILLPLQIVVYFYFHFQYARPLVLLLLLLLLLLVQKHHCINHHHFLSLPHSLALVIHLSSAMLQILDSRLLLFPPSNQLAAEP